MHDRIFSIHDMVLAISIVQCLLLLLTRLLLPKRDPLANYALAVFLLVVSLQGIVTLLMWNNALSLPSFLSWQNLAVCSLFLHTVRGACLYFYVKVLTETQKHFQPIQLLHLLPVIVVFVYMLPGFWGADRDLSQSNLIIWYFAKCVSLAYVVAAWGLIWRYQSSLKHGYSEISAANTIWLSLLTAGFCFDWSWSLIISFVGDTLDKQTVEIVGIMHNYVIFVLVNALFIYTLVYSRMLPKVEESLLKDNQDDEKEDAKEKVLLGITEHQLHLESSITIEEYAQKIGLQVKSVSSVINRELNTNFFEFINTHRIDFAKQLLLSDQKLSISDVLRQSGFNNRSSFHRFFKRLEGVSPSEFRRGAVKSERVLS